MSSVAERTQKAFQDAVDAIVPTMPLLMHGSGDVAPSLVNPSSARLMAELTVQYIASLVDAAVDAQDMVLSDCRDDRRANLPIPPPLKDVAQRRKPPIPPPPPPLLIPTQSKEDRMRRKRRPAGEYWDEPLPPPKIRKSDEDDSSEEGFKIISEEDDDDLGLLVPADEWVGVVGVDIREERTRMAYVQAPFAIGPQAFIFPICHDAGLYGRVLEVQAAQRNLAPLLMDSAVMEMIRTEAVTTSATKRTGSKAKQKKSNSESGGKSKRNNEDDDEEENEEEEEEDEADEEEEEDEFSRPTWPGLDGIFPVYR